jgi:hypothetical protein
MDNIQKHNICINVPSSQTSKFHEICRKIFRLDSWLNEPNAYIYISSCRIKLQRSQTSNKKIEMIKEVVNRNDTDNKSLLSFVYTSPLTSNPSEQSE